MSQNIKEMTPTEIFEHIQRQYEYSYDRNRDDYNFAGLYFEIDRISKQLINEGRMTEGEEYAIDLKDGRQVIFKGYRNATEFYDMLNGKRTQVLSKEDSFRKEYSQLYSYSTGFGRLDGLGHRFPEKLKEFFVGELKPGRILSFEGSKYAYVCTRETMAARWLKRIYTGTDPHKVTAKNFMDSEEKMYAYSDDDIRRLYDEIKSFSLNVIPRIDNIDHFATETMNSMLKDVSNGSTAIYKIGNEELRVKKSLLKNEFTWYSKDGTKLSPDTVRAYLAWVHAKPTVLEFTHTDSKKERDLSLFIKKTSIENDYYHKLETREYYEAASLLKNEALENRKDFSITLKSYDNSDKAVSFAFMVIDNRCDIYRIEHKPGDTSSIEDSKRIDETSLGEFLKERYDGIEMILADREAARIRNQYPDRTPVRDRITERTSHKSANDTVTNIKKQESNINEIKSDVAEFLDSFAQSRDFENSPLTDFEKLKYLQDTTDASREDVEIDGSTEGYDPGDD